MKFNRKAKLKANKSAMVEKLMQEGYAAIKEANNRRAIVLGERLRKLRHTSGFEILALAFAASGKLSSAIRTLERGVREAPSVWLLWNLLGNYYSDKGLYLEALDAYGQALKCSPYDNSFVQLNRAIVFNRQGRHIHALRTLKRVTNPSLQLAASTLSLKLLNALERYDEVAKVGARILMRNPKRDAWITDWQASDRARPSHLAELHAQLGLAVWKRNGQKQKALFHARKAIRLDRSCNDALWLIREIESQNSARSSYYRLLVRGTWPRPILKLKRPAGFFTKFDVVADDVDESLNLIRRLEPAAVRKSLVIEECELIERRPNGLKGVYATTGYAFFPTRQKLPK